MNPETAARLVALNRQFYQSFAGDFSATRQRLQPGVQRVLDRLPVEASVLDLGCGNGALARTLAARGHRGPYLGADFSPPLLREARATLEAFPRFRAAFLAMDLTSPAMPAPESGAWTRPVDRAFAFAVLHHLPGEAARLALLRLIRAALAPHGEAVISNWQFLSSERLRARIVPWERAGRGKTEVDAGDYLLDWRAGGVGYRYAHHFSVAEVEALAGAAGLRVVEHFRSDGQGKNMGLYTTLSKEILDDDTSALPARPRS